MVTSLPQRSSPMKLPRSCSSRAFSSMALLPLLGSLAFATVPSAGLVAAYTFNSSSADSSGHGHDAWTSGVTKTTNRFGTASSAYYFNGSTSILTIADHDDFSVNTTGYLSISVWVRPEGT